MKIDFTKSEIIFGFIFFLITVGLYLNTIAPGVLQIDSGELAAVQYNFGVAHPTGYPLFTFVGFMWSKLNPGFTPIFWLNLLALIFTSLSGIVVYNIALKLYNNIIKENRIFILKSTLAITSAIIASGFLFFSRTFWQQSTGVEVYALQLFLFSLILNVAIDIYLNYSPQKALYLAVVVALGFTNHLTTLLTVPGLIYLHFRHHGLNVKSLKTFIIPGIAGLGILFFFYGLLMWRASHNPVLNWGNISNFENLFRHISGWQYRVWMFNGDAAQKNLKFFFEGLPFQFTWLGLILLILGIRHLYQVQKPWAIYLSINMVFATLYVIYYDIKDLDSYFLFTYMNMSIAIGASIPLLFEKLNFLKDYLQYNILFVLILFFPIIRNFEAVSQKDITVYDDYTIEALNSAESNAIIFSVQWDIFISPSLYYQFVENMRPDVIIIDKELLRRSWYYTQLKTWDSNVMSKIEDETNRFLESLQPFEREEKFNANLIQANFTRLISNLITKNINERPIYIAPELVENDFGPGKDIQLPKGYSLVPQTFFYRVYQDGGYKNLEKFPTEEIQYPKLNNYYTRLIKNLRTNILIQRASYEKDFGNVDEKEKILGLISNKYPEFKIPESLIRK